MFLRNEIRKVVLLTEQQCDEGIQQFKFLSLDLFFGRSSMWLSPIADEYHVVILLHFGYIWSITKDMRRRKRRFCGGRQAANAMGPHVPQE